MKTPTAPFPPNSSSRYHVFVGVDSAARSATVAWMHPGQPISRPINIEQTPTGFALLQQTLLALEGVPSRILIVMEATGAYWEKLAVSLVQQGFVVSGMHPPQAHDFAKALLKRARARCDRCSDVSAGGSSGLSQPHGRLRRRSRWPWNSGFRNEKRG